MNEREQKVIAFLLGIVFKLSINDALDDNEIQSIRNLMSEFGTNDLDEREFRY